MLSPARTTAAFFECDLRIGLRCPQCWRKSKESAHQQRNPHGENQNVKIEPDLLCAWQRRGQKLERGARAPHRQKHPTPPRRNSQQKALSEQLADYPPTARSQRRAHSKLAAPPRRSR